MSRKPRTWPRRLFSPLGVPSTVVRPDTEKQWLARIASNKAKDYLRSAWARRVSIPGDEMLSLHTAPPTDSPEHQVLEQVSAQQLTDMITGLREPYHTPCCLVLLEGCTAAEAALRCGRPVKTVEAQYLPGQKNAGATNFSPVQSTRKGGPTGWNCSKKTDV